MAVDEKQFFDKLAQPSVIQNQATPNGVTDEEFGALIDGTIRFPTSPYQIAVGQPSVKLSDFGDIYLSRIYKDKGYKNLSYNQLRYALKIFNENSDEFKQIYSNITTTDLGVLFEEFSFNNFDEAIFNETNNLLQGVINLDQLPKFFVKGQGAQNGYYLRYPDKTDSSGKISAGPSLIEDIRQTYLAENSLDLQLESGPFNGAGENLKLEGNPSGLSEQPKYKIPLTALKAIINAFTGFGIFSGDSDYNSISDMVNEGYKTFLIQSLREDSPATIKSNFEGQVKNTSSIVAFYVAYDYEYIKRERLLTDYDVSIPPEENIAAAEAAALSDLAASGLVGEGGFQQKQDPVNPEEAQKFYEQCILLATMNDLKKHFNKKIKDESSGAENEDSDKEKIHESVPYQGRFYMVEAPSGRNQRLINFLSAPHDKKNDFLNITPDIQAFLTPKLRLFKVFNLKDEDVQQVEFIFKNTTSANTKLRRLFQDDSKFFRGSGYGIKNFSFSFNGTTPALAKNDITAELTLFFQDFSDFVTEHTTTEGTFKFVDLIFYDKKNDNNPLYGYGATHPDQYSPSYYRIRADVGWNVPEDNLQFDDACRKRGLDPDNIRDVIEKTNRSYYLNMVEHDLNFKKDGTVEIKAQYRGYVESVLKGTDMDALVDSQILADRASRANTMRTALRDCTPGEIARIKRIYAAQELRTIKETRKRFYERLIELDKIHTYDVLDDGGFRVNGYFQRQPKGDVFGKDIGELSKDKFNFYYLGDLLYVMLDTMYENSNVTPNIKSKFIVPSIDFEAFFEGSENFSINIAQIPIADRYFEEWWTENVIKEDRRSFPIMFFLRKLLNDLVANALIDVCLNRDYQRSFNFQTTTINAANDPLSKKAGAKTPTGVPSNPVIQLSSDILPFSVPEGTKMKDIMNYVVVYPSYSTSLPIGNGDYTEDLKNAVYHFNLGQDRGIVNEVKFSKVDMQYIREARYKREGIDGLLQLGAVYTANLQMFGNTLFYPGMQIFINPFGIGGQEFIPNHTGSIANKLGLGGYHLITKVNSSIGSGLFKTNVDAQFIYSGDGDSRKIKQGESEPNNNQPIENPPSTEQTCAKLVKAVEDDYLNLVANGESTNLAAEAALDANAENLTNTLVNAGANIEDITPEEAQQESQSSVLSPIPDTGVNVGVSPEDLTNQDERQQLVDFLGFDPNNPTGEAQ